MIEQVRTILNNEVGVVLKSPDLLLLMLRTYSAIYLNGEAPRACEKCQRGYYEQLKKDGMERAALTEKIKNRTCVPGWVGRRYVTRIAEFLIPEFMHDEKAIEMLKIGALKESDFKVLPLGYQKEQPKGIDAVIESNTVTDIEQAKEVIKKGRKPKQ